jgi:hypothetical protein
MEFRHLFLAFIVIPIAVQSQSINRPVLDSTVTCSYYKATYEYGENAAKAKQILEVFYIVEEMPKIKFTKSDIETSLNDRVLMNEKEISCNGTINFQCVVNCKGIAGDFQIINCSTGILNIGYQVINILRDNFFEWEPGKQHGQSVDVLIQGFVSVHNGKFSVVIPFV